jgi:hypothetical protein
MNDNFFYAINRDVENRETVSGVVAFSKKSKRDEYVENMRAASTISSSDADTQCRKTYERTARQAKAAGFI